MSDRGGAVYALLRHMRPIVLNSARVVTHTVRDVGWTVGSRAVVEVLASGPATVPQIASQLSLARQIIQRHVDALMLLGHASTKPNPSHRRSVLVELTAAGRSAFERIHADELTEMSRLAGACTAEELTVALKVLASLDADIRTRADARRST